MIKRTTHNRGLIKMIIVIVIALLIVSYLGINIRSIVASPTFQDNWSYVQGIVLYVWEHFLKVPVLFVWNIIIGLLAKQAAQQ